MTDEVLSHHDRKYEKVIALLNQRRTIKTISQKANLPELKISEWKIKAIATGSFTYQLTAEVHSQKVGYQDAR
jgi:hypothetical protein